MIALTLYLYLMYITDDVGLGDAGTDAHDANDIPYDMSTIEGFGGAYNKQDRDEAVDEVIADTLDEKDTDDQSAPKNSKKIKNLDKKADKPNKYRLTREEAVAQYLASDESKTRWVGSTELPRGPRGMRTMTKISRKGKGNSHICSADVHDTAYMAILKRNISSLGGPSNIVKLGLGMGCYPPSRLDHMQVSFTAAALGKSGAILKDTKYVH